MITLFDRLSFALYCVIDRVADAMLAAFGEGWE